MREQFGLCEPCSKTRWPGGQERPTKAFRDLPAGRSDLRDYVDGSYVVASVRDLRMWKGDTRLY
jgi:hypothetical protein